MEKLRKYCLDELKDKNFDRLAVAVLDFKNFTFDALEFENGREVQVGAAVFDLASLTKPLTLGLAFQLFPADFSIDQILLLEHRGGLPSWGRLSRSDWKEQVLSYPISKSKTLYSDFSALRLMLDLESKWGESIYQRLSSHWDGELKNWLDLDSKLHCPVTGWRNGHPIQGDVHDDNAFVINERVSHAGLFSNINSLARTLIDFDQNNHLLENMLKEDWAVAERFIKGWDRPTDLERTLAGKGCSKETFGHLGFTGTSIWIDARTKKGHIILTNETKKYWYDRAKINEFRRNVGEMIWNDQI
ncbi:serine hydrolase [Halobacteriovorax sp. GB3]|uniref:serine hydrolase n=1 Tax=Halobacteriovorax sp. GB3 TaxID=2719615 RepID=UPI00235FE9E9|nr:serine hydrolase [Halobacteriovorax sp. GB3]MDD0852635.1 serine hydrolase [Halobacteriovorax sp. GB3]